MPFDPNPTGDLKQDMNFQELARGLDQLFEGGVTINGRAVDVDFLVKALGGIVGLFVNGANGQVGIGTVSPAVELEIVSAGQARIIARTTTDSFAYLQLANSVQGWRFQVQPTTGEFRFFDVTNTKRPFKIFSNTPEDSVRLEVAAVVIRGLRLVGRTATAADPTTTELPADKDFGLHKNTSSGAVFLAYNDGGVVKKVALT